MINLCEFCKVKNFKKGCKILNDILVKTSHAEQLAEDVYGTIITITVKNCKHFKPNKKEVEVRHVCFSCKNSNSCDLWEQVCNIDEDFIKNAYEYDPTVQSVCSTVSYCALYSPK